MEPLENPKCAEIKSNSGQNACDCRGVSSAGNQCGANGKLASVGHSESCLMTSLRLSAHIDPGSLPLVCDGQMLLKMVCGNEPGQLPQVNTGSEPLSTQVEEMLQTNVTMAAGKETEPGETEVIHGQPP